MHSRLAVSTMLMVASSALLATQGPANAASTIVWKSQGVAIISLVNTPMAEGSTAQAFTSKYVETVIDGEMKGQSVGGECVGLGLVTAEGVYSGQAHCSVTVNADDGWTIDYRDNAEGGDWIVTGGKGKFKGATGKGHTTYTWGDSVYGDKITMAADGIIELQ